MWKTLSGVIIVGSALYYIKKYFAGAVCNCKKKLNGLTIIITGGSSGIGKALAFELASRGATLILACRNTQEGTVTKKEIEKKNDVQVFVKELDLNSFNSIIKFSENISREFDQIYALINNAGVFYHPQQLTVDNFDITLQTNYLGPFVLTHHLLKVLKRSQEARIINVVSAAHKCANSYDLKAITLCQQEFRCHFKAYGVSKLALILFTKHLSKRLVDSNIIVTAVNPGNVETKIFRYYPLLSNPWSFALQWIIRVFVIKRPYEGAQPILHAVLTPSTATGLYLEDCQEKQPSATALAEKLAEDYYNLTLELLADKFSTESDC